jgi:hypothetical protein
MLSSALGSARKSTTDDRRHRVLAIPHEKLLKRTHHAGMSINQTVTLWIIVRPSNDGLERRFDNGSGRSTSACKALTFSGVCIFEIMDMVLRCCATEDVPP